MRQVLKPCYHKGVVGGAILRLGVLSWMSVNVGQLVPAGLPEEVAITKAALARSMDVLALTTKEQTYRCWDTEWPSKSEDIPRVRHPSCPHVHFAAACSKVPGCGNREQLWKASKR